MGRERRDDTAAAPRPVSEKRILITLAPTPDALSRDPRKRRAWLFAHQPDRQGSCLACVAAWPCEPYRAAEQAEDAAQLSVPPSQA